MRPQNSQRRTILRRLATLLLTTLSIIITLLGVSSSEPSSGRNIGHRPRTLTRRNLLDLDANLGLVPLLARQNPTTSTPSTSNPSSSTPSTSTTPTTTGSDQSTSRTSAPASSPAPATSSPAASTSQPNSSPLGGLIGGSVAQTVSPSSNSTNSSSTNPLNVIPSTPSTTNSSSPTSATLPATTSAAPKAHETAASKKTPSSGSSANQSGSDGSSSTSTTDQPAQNQSKGSSAAKTTFKTIGIIGGVIGGAFLLWNIIRKWKFRPSKRFAQKLEQFDDENNFNPRPPSFAEKRPNEHYNNFNSTPIDGLQSPAIPAASGYSPHRISVASARQYPGNGRQSPLNQSRSGLDPMVAYGYGNGPIRYPNSPVINYDNQNKTQPNGYMAM